MFLNSGRPRLAFFNSVAVVSLAFISLGCGGSEFSIANKVEGTVTLNGKPLPKATVLFQPIGKGNPGPSSSGMTDDDGHFVLTFADGKPGAVIGKHRVVVTTRQVAPKSDNPDVEEVIAPELVPASYVTEPPTVDVPSGGTSDAKIDLNGPVPSKPGQIPEED